MDSVVFPQLPTFLFDPSLAGVLSLLLTVVLPLVAALLMKQSWSAFTKGLVLLALSAVKAYLEAWIGAGGDFNAVTAAYAVIVNFGIAVAAYFGLLRNTSAQQAAISSGVSDSKTIDGRAYPTSR